MNNYWSHRPRRSLRAWWSLSLRRSRGSSSITGSSSIRVSSSSRGSSTSIRISSSRGPSASIGGPPPGYPPQSGGLPHPFGYPPLSGGSSTWIYSSVRGSLVSMQSSIIIAIIIFSRIFSSSTCGSSPHIGASLGGVMFKLF